MYSVPVVLKYGDGVSTRGYLKQLAMEPLILDDECCAGSKMLNRCDYMYWTFMKSLRSKSYANWMEYGLFCLLVVVPAPVLEFQFESFLPWIINHTFVGFLFIFYQHILPLLFLIFVACSFPLSLSLVYTFISTFSRVSFFFYAKFGVWLPHVVFNNVH